MAVFVNFMFSNAIFTHVHKGLDGRQVAHSHPYLPSSGHTHSSNSLDLTAAFNASASAAVAVTALVLLSPKVVCDTFEDDTAPHMIIIHHVVKALRAPPALRI